MKALDYIKEEKEKSLKQLNIYKPNVKTRFFLIQTSPRKRAFVLYIENVTTFLERHPLAKLTIMSEAPHYFHTAKQKKFIKDWITRNIYR